MTTWSPSTPPLGAKKWGLGGPSRHTAAHSVLSPIGQGDNWMNMERLIDCVNSSFTGEARGAHTNE